MTSNFHIKFNINDDPYEANVSVVYHDESNYGADADGNRGTTRRFIDDVIIRGVIDKRAKLVNPSPEMINEINKIAEKEFNDKES